MVTCTGSLYWWPSVCWWPGPSPSLSSSSCHWTSLPLSSGPDSFIRCTLKITLFDFSNRIQIVRLVINYKFFLSNHDFFSINKSVVNRKVPKPQLVISAPAPGGNLIKFWLLGSGSTTLVLSYVVPVHREIVLSTAVVRGTFWNA